MMFSRDKFMIQNCVLQNGKNLLCEIPEVCSHCIYFKYKGKGKKYLLAAYHAFYVMDKELSSL